MNFNLGDKITTKKPHACGERVWTVTRLGADVKITCDKCGRSVFLSKDKLISIIKAEK